MSSLFILCKGSRYSSLPFAGLLRTSKVLATCRSSHYCPSRHFGHSPKSKKNPSFPNVDSKNGRTFVYRASLNYESAWWKQAGGWVYTEFRCPGKKESTELPWHLQQCWLDQTPGRKNELRTHACCRCNCIENVVIVEINPWISLKWSLCPFVRSLLCTALTAL